MSGPSATPTPPLNPAEMQVLIARAGLTPNPGQVADLVLAWRQIVGLLALIPRDRPLLDDQAFVFRVPPPAPARPAAPAKPAATPRQPPSTARKTAAPAGKKAAARPGKKTPSRRAKKAAPPTRKAPTPRAAKKAATRKTIRRRR